jgi:hypothetical protein
MNQDNTKYIVSRDAMRPASLEEMCFYCHQPIGQEHKESCVLIKKKVKVRMTVEYIISVPNEWDKDQIEFHRNDSTWCADNAIKELEEFSKGGCLCQYTNFEYLGDETNSFLQER